MKIMIKKVTLAEVVKAKKEDWFYCLLGKQILLVPCRGSTKKYTSLSLGMSYVVPSVNIKVINQDYEFNNII